MMMFGFFPFFLLLFFFVLPAIERRDSYNRRRRQMTAELDRKRSQENRKDVKLAKNDYEKKVFTLAAKFRGRLMLSDVILETGLGMKDSEKLMDGITDGLHVKAEPDSKGILFYEFPETDGKEHANDLSDCPDARRIFFRQGSDLSNYPRS